MSNSYRKCAREKVAEGVPDEGICCDIVSCDCETKPFHYLTNYGHNQERNSQYHKRKILIPKRLHTIIGTGNEVKDRSCWNYILDILLLRDLLLGNQ